MKYSINVLRNQMGTTANQINSVEANIEGIFHNKEFKDGNVKYREKKIKIHWGKQLECSMFTK